MGTVRFTIKILVSDCDLLSLANFWKRNDIFR
jgi:hypothetical protein